MITDSVVYFCERNIRGAIVVYGKLGVRQYYGYSMTEAKRRYKDEYKRTYIDPLKALYED